MSDVKVIQFLKANYGEVHSIKPDLWGALVDGKRTLFRLERTGMLIMRVEQIINPTRSLHPFAAVIVKFDTHT